ncbi:hypothetical protein L0P88_04165 [Muricauda sp. SCSIO 64092]|uniref:hypothetical protein n=1 Tax=Allomuricauda sp. SCSIO 64092 TaxID=2908842 RepID=UPI001FF25937|nr:hypothetical protein [Muricauda sp. SCSIO 64092]UOY07750.1 hypothetical protein L0P88_04165 [Muricauda sp. SCSIO 64092]
MINLRKKSTSKATSGPFYGKKIELEEALETTHQLVDYLEALKQNRPRVPMLPNKDLVYWLRCNQITMYYYTKVNLQLQGIGYRRSYLTESQLVALWVMVTKSPSDKPLITLGNKRILFDTT